MSRHCNYVKGEKNPYVRQDRACEVTRGLSTHSGRLNAEEAEEDKESVS